MTTQEKTFVVAATIGGWLQTAQFTGTYDACIVYAESHGLGQCDIYDGDTFTPDYL